MQREYSEDISQKNLIVKLKNFYSLRMRVMLTEIIKLPLRNLSD